MMFSSLHWSGSGATWGDLETLLAWEFDIEPAGGDSLLYNSPKFIKFENFSELKIHRFCIVGHEVGDNILACLHLRENLI